MTTSFVKMGLNPQLLVALEQLGFSDATPVQAALVPKALEGGDWIVSSQTGSGKTAAFLLPMLELVFQKKAEQIKQSPTAPWTLVLCPTRELAQQVANDAINLVKGAKGVRIATVTGGASYYVQRKNINGAQLIVATPGRLLDLAQSGAIDLSQVELLTLDEADRMLDFGFSEEIQAIAGKCSNREQTLMFSATFTPRETRLAADLMSNPQRVTIDSATEKHTNITQHLHWVDNSHHQNQLLAHWLKDESLDQAVIFSNTQIDAERLAAELEKQGYLAAALHGGMPQNVRNRRLDALRKGRTKILVATDVAARGIDVPTITHVFNFGLPMKAEDYVHRIGRTGRAGRNGTAITFAQFSDGRRLREVEFYTKQKFIPKVIEGLEPQNKPEDYARASKPRGGNRNGSSRGYGPSNASGGYRGEQRSYGNGGGNTGSRSGIGNPRSHSERTNESRPVRDGFPGQTRRADAAAPAWAKNERPQRRESHNGAATAERGFYGRKTDGSPSSQRPRSHDGQQRTSNGGNGGNSRPQRSRSGY
ncbi:DEAD/DEAH box helicase [Formosimonas limnophila]|uniref:DEAD/DEAH box helicase n=1 Tax=Formosimonas limnophila TaxID=1384487 RepID=A0A8J3FXV4_9BURK|nr:DEAD/DEAH box helicase [Formosimonas limnophila]GHA67947.1 DEAD/DEAH box helicase [Formosimonas limnophila]